MPLSFHSESHGNIAFGFFNIKTDLLLLEHYFFFADDFCSLLKNAAAETSPHGMTYRIQGYYIEKNEDIGDLMGAIHGQRFEGFIGEVYKKYPFPQLMKDFKQDPNGFETRSVSENLISPFARPCDIALIVLENQGIKLCDCAFSQKVFFELINYVWQGGYPRWKDEVRPQYVADMASCIDQSENLLFREFELNGLIESIG